MQTPENIVMRERVDFSKIKTSIPIPNLIEIQKKSYEKFLQMDLLPANMEVAFAERAERQTPQQVEMGRAVSTAPEGSAGRHRS